MHTKHTSMQLAAAALTIFVASGALCSAQDAGKMFADLHASWQQMWCLKCMDRLTLSEAVNWCLSESAPHPTSGPFGST